MEEHMEKNTDVKKEAEETERKVTDGETKKKKSETGFWNSRKWQNVICMIGLLMMTISIVAALLFCFTMDIDEDLDYYGVEYIIEETMMSSEYTNSRLFTYSFMKEAETLAEEEHARTLFETDGKFDENKTIDLAYVFMLIDENAEATGITYRIGDLLAWKKLKSQTQWINELQFDAIVEAKSEDQTALIPVEELNEILPSSSDMNRGSCVYVEEKLPTDGKSLYLHAGDLDTMAMYTEYLEELLPFVRSMYDTYLRQDKEPVNIGIARVSPALGLVYCSFADYTGIRQGSFEEINAALYEYVSQKEYGAVYHYGTGTILEGKMNRFFYDEEQLGRAIGLNEGDRLYVVLDAELPSNDFIWRVGKWYETVKTMTKGLVSAFVIGLILFLTAFVRRTMLEGRSETQKPRLIDRWFTVLLLAVIVLMIVSAFFPLLLLQLFGEWYWSYYNMGNMTGVYLSGGGMIAVSVIAVFVIASVVFYCYYELVNRLKKHTLYQKSLLRFLIAQCKKAVRCVLQVINQMLKLVNGKVKWAVGYLLFLLINFFAVMFAFDGFAAPFILFLIADLFIGAAVLVYFREQDTLREHMEATVQGSREEPLTVGRFHGMNQKTAELVNDMDSGISRAVEKSIKDERMRTELIANVSHDIRTPLTSIINYVDLLKKEPIESENAKKYLDVLDEKSARLKQLTEDLVEASRITSGNISVVNVRMSAAELVQQIAAEYEEKFYEKELTLVLQVPENEAEDSFIGDSRYVWRVLSNLFNNLYKYAMPRTRVYFSMYRTPTPTFCMELKNISEYPLNISPEELTERFVRGDSSRGTEGNGLGLSIAQSLMNVMHGSLKIRIDGDLFKVILNFPLAL